METATNGVSTSTSMPLILDGNFFRVVSEHGTKVVGQCTLCPSKIMGLKTTTSNFNTHLKKMHPERHKVYEEYKILKGQTIKKRRTSNANGPSNDNGNGVSPPVRRRRSANGTRRMRNSIPGMPGPGRGRPKSNIAPATQVNGNGIPDRRHTFNAPQDLAPLKRRRSSHLMQQSGLQSLTNLNPVPVIRSRKKEIEDMIFNYVVQSFSPPSIVESPHFMTFVNGLTATFKKFISQESLEARITMQALVQRNDLIRILGSVDFLCVTADMWSLITEPANSFFSMTAHWVSGDLKIRSVLLCCRRWREEQTYSKVVDVITQVLGLYNIQKSKICCLVTNTGSSLLPTRIYQIQHLDESAEIKNSHEHEGEGLCNDDLSFVDLSSMLSCPPTETDEVPPVAVELLPSHYDCPTQTLIGVLTTSVFEALSNPDRSTSYVFQSSIAKCQALWKACSCKESQEKIHESYGMRILTPNKLNWNSFLESIMSLLTSRNVTEEVCNFFGISSLEESEWDFLEEYVMAMTPITKALNVLQDENDLYMGSFVPTILNVKAKLEELLTEEEPLVDLAKPLVEALLNGLNGPFSDIIQLNESARPLILASILHPYFKLRWVPADKVEELKAWYLEEALNYAKAAGEDGTGDSSATNGESSSSQSQVEKRGQRNGNGNGSMDSDENDFFPFSSDHDVDESEEVSTSVLLEFIQYLDTSCEKIEAGQLDRFPNVRKLFITFNTAISSSIPLERLMKFAEVSQAPSRAVLKDDTFEDMMLLKCNL